MLNIDLAGISPYMLSDVVADHCKLFGLVKSVKIHHVEGKVPDTFALITMATIEEARKVADKFNGAVFNNDVLVHLDQS